MGILMVDYRGHRQLGNGATRHFSLKSMMSAEHGPTGFSKQMSLSGERLEEIRGRKPIGNLGSVRRFTPVCISFGYYATSCSESVSSNSPILRWRISPCSELIEQSIFTAEPMW